jgi:hypothetical protein
MAYVVYWKILEVVLTLFLNTGRAQKSW